MDPFLSESLHIKRVPVTRLPESQACPRMEDLISREPRDLGRAVCIITGASKGYGRALAFQLSCRLKPRSVLVLVARTKAQLNELKDDIVSVCGRSQLDVRCVQADLEEAGGVEKTVQAVKETSSTETDHVLLINNAASLGDVSRFAVSFTDPAEVNRYLSLNVSGALSLTAGVLQAFPHRLGLRRTVVNISSLCALKPFPSWVLYCTGKAARDMMFRVLAEEEPDVRVLSYAPGPLDTDMQLQARRFSGDLNLRRSFSSMFSEHQLLTCEESGSKLVKLLLDNDFPSGAHLDFYEL
ncbi:sepiapterin reductase b [Pimephales promelas]|uniref:sepiapterin reductase b n=1 Tax=Pimephales promelas TaxID=90988 RepID=UPI0019555809|nr:sepiapterin reductase b [Pimephales promelas]KAG1930282.1 sepiapterin reductase [Pimephales promelas]